MKSLLTVRTPPYAQVDHSLVRLSSRGTPDWPVTTSSPASAIRMLLGVVLSHPVRYPSDQGQPSSHASTLVGGEFCPNPSQEPRTSDSLRLAKTVPLCAVRRRQFFATRCHKESTNLRTDTHAARPTDSDFLPAPPIHARAPSVVHAALMWLNRNGVI